MARNGRASKASLARLLSFELNCFSFSSSIHRHQAKHYSSFRTGFKASSARCESYSFGRLWNSTSLKYITRRSYSRHDPALSNQVSLQPEDHDLTDRHQNVASFQEDVQSSLLQKDYRGLINVFRFAGENNLDFIRNLPENTLTEVLAHLQPKNDLGKAIMPYSRLSPAMVHQLHLPTAYDLIRGHLLDAVQILDHRQRSGKTLSVVDYGHILGFARWTGLRDVADTFWKSMQADDIVPDLNCYNNYLGAIVSNLRHDPNVKHTRRMTTFRIEARSKPYPGPSYAAYRFGTGGVKEDVMMLHREILKLDIVPNEETFRLLILGVGREGDLNSVRKLLRQVWSIDVDAIVNGQEEGHSVRELNISPTSPLYPTSFLIYAVAHVFGINNEIPSALRLVDHISQTYKVQVFDYVWHELLKCTFVLSAPRQASRKEQAILPKGSVQKLWQVMRNEPYNVRPTIDMYDKLVKSLFHQQRTQDMWRYMCEALPLYEEMRKKTRNFNQALHRALKTSQPVGTLQQKYDRSRLDEKSSRLFLKRWVRLLLASMRSWRRVDGNLLWSTQLIPKIILDWKDFMPSNVWYDIAAGRVSIIFRASDEKEVYQAKIMNAMDTNDRVASKHMRLAAEDGNRYVLTRRQQRGIAARGRVHVDEQCEAEEVSASEQTPELDVE
jgi:hypothetical protein